jgi:hypothetical protein
VSAAVEGPAVAFVFAVACLLHTIKKTVISTEAAHSLIVSRAVEKSAFSSRLPAFTQRMFLHKDTHTISIVTILSSGITIKNTRIPGRPKRDLLRHTQQAY